MKYIIALVIIAAFVYGVFSFGNWELNPGEWSEDSRVACSIVFGVVSVMSVAGIAAWKKEFEE